MGTHRTTSLVFSLSLFSLFFLQILDSSVAKAGPPSRYEKVRARLNQIASSSGGNAQLFTLGVGDSGQPIEGLIIGNGSISNLVVGTHHGNEYGSTEVALGFAAALAANPIQGQMLFVIPVLNITGYNANQRWEQGNDPNRDYPGPCGSEGPFKLKSTAALARFVDQQQIVASATLHSYYPAVVYPWGLASRDLSTPYESLFKELVNLATQDSGYQTGNSTEVIYPANGTFEDYAYWKHGIWSLLFELGYSHSPSETEISELVRKNVPGLVRVMEKAPRKRADEHAFKGACDLRLLSLDRHDE